MSHGARNLGSEIAQALGLHRTAVKRIWHIQDSQGHINNLALTVIYVPDSLDSSGARNLRLKIQGLFDLNRFKDSGLV